MEVIRDREALAATLGTLRAEGARVAFVPTMGALHAGHIALIEAAKRPGTKVVASIFVNPRQFGAGEDLGRYPRREASDLRMLTEAGCDAVWMPSVETMYPEGHATTIHVAGVSEGFDGEARPGHFDGVATVVAKLFNQVRPDIAYFGEKDFQQLAVIRRMVADLSLPIEVRCCPVVREPDGLALSSRNRLLSADQREAATCLFLALSEAAELARAGERDAGKLVAAMAREIGATSEAHIDYVAVVDEDTFEQVPTIEGRARALVAARFGGVRLIDTLLLPAG